MYTVQEFYNQIEYKKRAQRDIINGQLKFLDFDWLLQIRKQNLDRSAYNLAFIKCHQKTI